MAIVCPYCYKTFACDGHGLATKHARDGPRTYPFRFRHRGRDSTREMWRPRFSGMELMTATTRELSERHLLIF